jgi:menaquinol-cytochrome c reductase iron-sulfur subunit
MVARLVFLNGIRAGAALNLGDIPVTIGRNPVRTVVYSDDETMVSADHATIEYRDGHYVLKDDGSRNGTIVNSWEITEHILEHGDIIQFGKGGPAARFVVESKPGVVPTMDSVTRTTGSHRAVTTRHTSAMPAIVTAPHEEEADVPVATRTRRHFLRLVSVVAGTGAAILAGLPALLSFVSPILRGKREGTWVRLGDTSDFETGVPNKKDFAQTMKDAWVETRAMVSVWVYTEDGERFTVYDARCTHLGCGYNYVQTTGMFECPCHGGKFDAKSGAVLAGPPPRPLDKLPNKVEDGVLLVQLA